MGFSSNGGGGGTSSSDTDWATYTPTFTGFGTVATQSFRYRRLGPDVLIEGSFLAGTTTAVEARMSLPAGLTSSSTYGTVQTCGIASIDVADPSLWGTWPLIEASVTYLTFTYINGTSHLQTKRNGSQLAASGNRITLSVRVRIEGWGL